jgi:carbamoyl-phosphate synthase small subunit
MNSINYPEAIILLEDGAIFKGKSIGIEGTVTGEVCFNTGMTGYQEIFTDPSYFGQVMVTTNAHIGNYGVNNEEEESESIKISGLVCRNFSFNHSRIDSNSTLFDYLVSQKLIVITNVDTRALVSHIRDKGAMNAIISTETDIQKLQNILSKMPSMIGLELASKVSCEKPYLVGQKTAKYRIAVLDIGIKKNILNNLEKRDCYIKVFPFDATFSEMEDFNADGYFLSNGPGDPEPLIEAQELAKEIIKRDLPLFGICLGHQVIAQANGVRTYKMHNGHRGINHPVINLNTGKSEITSQNHGFVVDKIQVEKHPEFEITHLHLNDDTLAGMKMKNKPCFSVQYHPEASPGPHDSEYLFDNFIEMINSVN